MTEMPFSTVGKIGRLIGPSVSGGRPTQTSRPPRRSEAKACSNDGGDHGGHHGDVDATELLDGGDGVGGRGIDGVVGAQRHGPARAWSSSTSTATTIAADEARVLDGEVPETTHAEDRRPSRDGRMWATLMALYVVTPAQVSGAASKEVTPSGTGTTKSASATAYSAKAPSMA